MAILPVIIAPDPRLKQISAPVDRVDDDIRRLMDDMPETMYLAPGVGLAASVRRHHLRAGRGTGEQASSGYGLCPY